VIKEDVFSYCAVICDILLLTVCYCFRRGETCDTFCTCWYYSALISDTPDGIILFVIKNAVVFFMFSDCLFTHIYGD
jgi:hypothetical protein